MRWTRIPVMLGVVFATAALGSMFFFTTSGTTPATAATVHGLLSSQGTAPWAERNLTGSTQLAGQVPLSVTTSAARFVGPHSQGSVLRLNFSLALRDRATLDKLIALKAKTHETVTRAQLYARFTPPQAQVRALQHWLIAHGFTITHTGADRLSVGASAPVSTIERALNIKIADFTHAPLTVGKIQQPAFTFFANTAAPHVPARLGIIAISGLSDVDRFYTSAQLTTGKIDARNAANVRSGGYFPSDLKGLYNITGHGYDATGQTIGFTLWTAAERQNAMTAYANATGDSLITVDPYCTASGNSATTPSSCATATVQPDHLLTILENGNLDNNWGSNVETALDIEAAHGVANHVAMKYYASECATNPPANTGLANAGCNGTDAGMEMAMEDAANDPTLHSVSNSWGYGGEVEWGATDPFMVTTGNILALAAASGTSFYFSTGDFGTYQSGYATDSPYVVSVGGTSTYSTSNPAVWSTSVTWSAAGSWCSNIVARPSWQVAAGLSNASCPGRVSPDVSAIADPNTGVKYFDTTGVSTTGNGQVGGTSLAAPVMNGLQAVTQNFINAQTYPVGTNKAMGFVSPMLYTLGNSPNYTSYYRDIQCGNTANPSSGPDGDAAGVGWDPATGWGEPDWYNFSIGYAMALGATNLSVPPSTSRNFPWICAKTPSNSTERAFSCPTSGTCYAVGTPSGATPWYGKFLSGGVWGAVNTFFKSTDGGQTWFPSNSDMFSIACTSTSTCIEVGAGGRERRTTDSGATWTDTATAPGNNKPLTQVTCPSSSICYAVGDRGNAMKSTDGGQTWAWLQSTDGNPIYGLSCPDTSTCYATDIYAHVYKTADGGSSWTAQVTPITTPYTPVVAETGGPNPYAGSLAISCSSATTCVMSGFYVVPSGAGQVLPSSDAPIVTTTDGGTTWTRQTSNAGGTISSATSLSAAAIVGATNIKVASVSGFVPGQAIIVDSAGANPETVTVTAVGTSGAAGTGVSFTPALGFAHASGSVSILAPNYLHGISCLPGTTTCTSVGRNGKIVTTTNLTTWTAAASGTTNMLNAVTCLSSSFCVAVGQNGTVDVWNGATWTATTGNGGVGMLASVTCLDTSTCYATGKQGITIATTNGGGSWTIQAGGGTVQQVNGVSCTSSSTCYAVGNAGTILATTNGGQTWLPQTSGTSNPLNAVSCTSATTCTAVGGTGTILKTTNGGVTWPAQTSGTTGGLNGVSCSSGTACVAVGSTTTGSTSLSAAVSAGATNIKMASATGFANGQALQIDISGSNPELVTITSVGTAGAAGTGISFTPALAFAHASGVTISGSVALRYTTDGTTWNAGSPVGYQPLNAVQCTSASTCLAVGGNGAILRTSDGGATWSPQTSGTTNALNGVGCMDASKCVADGAAGTTLFSQDGGATWTRLGNPDSGPTSALNATSITLNGATCTASVCMVGTGAQGDILISSLLTVKVNTTSVYGTNPVTSGLSPSNAAITYSPSGEAANVVGTLNCSTTATSSSNVGSYPISSCSGLSDQGYTVVYDYANSSHTITKANQTITVGTHAPSSAVYGTGFTVSASSGSGNAVSYGSSGGCSNTGADYTMTSGSTDCTVTYDQAGDSNYNAASQVTETVTAQKADQAITIDTHAPSSAVYGTGFTVAAHGGGSGNPVVYGSTGGCSNTGGDFTMTSGTTACHVTYSQAGDSNYNAATSLFETVTAQKADQAITITQHAPSTAVYGSSFTVAANGGGSGNPVVYGASGVCSHSGADFTITGAGTCTVSYSQAGDSNYNAAPQQTETVTVNSKTLTLSTTKCTGTFSGTGNTLTVPAGKTCGLLPGTIVRSNLIVKPGGTLYVKGGVKIGGKLVSGGDSTVCGARIGRDVVVTNGPLLLGGQDCAGNKIAGLVSVSNAAGDVSIWNNRIGNTLTVNHLTGAHQSVIGNTVFGEMLVQNSGPIEVSNNHANTARCPSNTGLTGSGNTANGKNSCPA
jgi:photosystem II stability/assembly factor-like uncharacterized protein